MRYVFFGDAPLSHRILGWLCATHGPPILTVSDCPTPAQQKMLRHTLAGLQPDLGVSVKYRRILSPDVLALFGDGVVNLHNGYLPWNRGAHTNVWPLVDGSPAGVTLHWMDAGVDTGPAIAQTPVAAHPWDTAESLYDRLDGAADALFRETWPHVVAATGWVGGTYTGGGSVHRVADLRHLDTIDLDAPTTARAVLNQLRARTFPPYRGVTYAENGQVVEVTVNLRRVE